MNTKNEENKLKAPKSEVLRVIYIGIKLLIHGLHLLLF